MRPFDYLLLLVAVVLGLALSDLALSVQRLLNRGSRVRWDWLAPLAAAVAFLKIQTQWWVWFGGDPVASGLTFEMFTVLLLSAGLLFLLAATALPDEVHEGGLDLRVHFATVRRRYWILFALHFMVANTITAWIAFRVAGAQILLATPETMILPGAVVLVFVDRRWLDTVALVGLIVLYVVQEFGRTLAA